MGLFNNKNIIILLKSFVLGGAEKQALFLANYLQNKKNCKVYIYSYLPSSNAELFYKECKKYHLKNLFIVKNPLSASGKLKYLKRRIKIVFFGLKLRKHQPDIIIPYLNPPSIIANLCYKIAGAKTTFWHHRGADYYRNDKLEKVAVKHTHFFIANSENGLDELQKQFHLPNEKLFFLPNFSTIDIISESNKLPLKEKLKDKIVIGMIAHFREEKLQGLLVKSFHQLLKIHNNIHLVLVGNVIENTEDEINFNKTIDFIHKNELSKKITILHQTNANQILPLLDVGVLVSITEGMPNVVMEYMSYGLPIVTTSHSGCKSLLGNDYPYLVENTVDDITLKLTHLISNKEEREKIGNKNSQKLDKEYKIENYLNKLSVILK